MTTIGTTAKISIKGATKTFTSIDKAGDRVQTIALDGIDLDITTGEFVSVIGPSGCGKTTLLRLIAGLIPMDGGSIEINGTEIAGPGRDRAMVFQSFGLLPWKTVAQNVAFPLRIRKLEDDEIKERVDHFLDLVGLEKFGDRYPHQLSGGMQQRVGLARALAVDPDVLLMDEPFGAIDAQQRQIMQGELLKIWSSTDKTIVFITHDLDEAVYLSDRVVLLTPHPGKVRSVFDIDLPRNRWEYDVRGHEAFIESRRAIWSVLKDDVIEEVRREAEEVEE